jgi:glutamate-ammonia-ligase adenylyltransferase
MLVTSRTAFERYHEERAEAWERQILLRSRAIAGSQELAVSFEALRREILSRPPPEDLAEEIHRVRQRMELEIAQEHSGHYDFKTGRGGLLDVESIVQYLQLAQAAKHPELLEVHRLELQVERLAALGLLEEEAARAVLEGWEFLQRLSSALRVVENRSISDLDTERGDLDSLARRLGYDTTSREGGSRRALLNDYLMHTGQIRAVYTKLLAGS